jgi:arylsulfatase A-like enzyme/Tfp pilus assembly protein PilF
MATRKKRKPESRPPSSASPEVVPDPAGASTRRRPLNRVVLQLIPTMAAIGIAALFFFRHQVAPPAGPARNIILITVDTTRADALGYAGNTRVSTPFLDALAGRGIVFTNAHAHNVLTLPSHVNILTGLYPYQHGVRENAGFKLDPKHPTVATLLRSAGYATGAFVGAFPLDARFGLNQGFDKYDDNYGKGQASLDFIEQERRAGAVLEAAARWWNENGSRKRFMWVHLYDPHAPYAPPEPFLSSYRGQEYLGEIAYVDDALAKAIGPILAADPDALVVFTSDHGESLGEHGERTHGLFAYEATLRIPLLVARRGVAHRVEREYVRHVDIVPTILEAAMLPVPKGLPGRSLLGKVQPGDSYFESLSGSLNRGWAPLTGIIHGRLKYVDLPLAELYDLPRDPGETHNLRDERRRDVEEARRVLAPALSALPAPRVISGEEASRLRSLGYITGSAGTRDHYTAADDPKSLVALDSKMHDAVDAFEHHDPALALRLAREVVAARPSMTTGREMLAFMLEQNDRVREAIDQLKMIVADPNASDGNRVQLALLYCETAQPRAAIALLAARTATLDPDLLNAYGVALSDDSQHAEAQRQFERVLTLDPNNAPALQNLGILSLRRDDAGSAKTYLNRALELNPKLPLALNTLGVVYAQSNQFEQAVDAWNRAVSIDPRQYDALLNIGIVESRLGHREEARIALQRFVRTAPRSTYASDIATAERRLNGN